MTPSAQSSFKARIAKEMSCTKGNNALPGSGLPGSGLAFESSQKSEAPQTKGSPTAEIRDRKCQNLIFENLLLQMYFLMAVNSIFFAPSPIPALHHAYEMHAYDVYTQ
jgi:hypothetical protein